MSKDHHANDLAAARHTAAHILAAASTKLKPDTKLGVGPAIDDGFYHDIDVTDRYSDSDLATLETKMQEIVKMDLPITQRDVSKEEARKIFAHDPYKLELIEEIPEDTVGISDMGDGFFVTLCRGGHVESTGQIGAFKLTRLAGAYWKGDETRPQLQRVYGILFPTQAEVDKHLELLEEAKKRDHRKLGKELDLFTFSDLVGSGLPLYTPKGAFIRRALQEYIEQFQAKIGYTHVWTPQIAKAELFKISGHYAKFHEDMFQVKSHYSEEEFYLKPMNCPQHTQIYNSQPRSYRDLPLRYADFAMLYRDEQPGQLNGLARVRAFSQDDCHIFCREDQIDQEIDNALSLTKEVLATFGFKYRYRLSTRDPEHPEKYLGNPETWDKVEKWAETIMKRHQIDYFPGPGEASFYAPKMDLMATDALGREWQLSTVQIDFVQPERFDLTYIDADGQRKRPVMIHHATLGSFERFMMMLLEHYAGALPTWLSPTQVMIIPIGEGQHDKAQEVTAALQADGIRVETDTRSESMGKKIREAQQQKIPYMVIIGKKEIAANVVAIRSHRQGDLGTKPLVEFQAELLQEIKEKRA